MVRRNKPQIPSPAECLDLMEKHHMPVHVKRHSELVSRLAIFLGDRVNETGREIDIELVRAAGLLHDITKIYSFNRPLDHALTGAKLLKKMGYFDVAQIVRQHVRISSSRPQGRVSEIELVNYADKRVVNDQVTTLSERIKYIKDRYAKTPLAKVYIERGAMFMFQLENEIFRLIPQTPDYLLTLGQDLKPL